MRFDYCRNRSREITKIKNVNPDRGDIEGLQVVNDITENIQSLLDGELEGEVSGG